MMTYMNDPSTPLELAGDTLKRFPKDSYKTANLYRHGVLYADEVAPILAAEVIRQDSYIKHLEEQLHRAGAHNIDENGYERLGG